MNYQVIKTLLKNSHLDVLTFGNENEELLFEKIKEEAQKITLFN